MIFFLNLSTEDFNRAQYLVTFRNLSFWIMVIFLFCECDLLKALQSPTVFCYQSSFEIASVITQKKSHNFSFSLGLYIKHVSMKTLSLHHTFCFSLCIYDFYFWNFLRKRMYRFLSTKVYNTEILQL